MDEIRKSLDLRNWEAAQKLVRYGKQTQRGAVTVSGPCDKFIADAIARNVSEAMGGRHVISGMNSTKPPKYMFACGPRSGRPDRDFKEVANKMAGEGYGDGKRE